MCRRTAPRPPIRDVANITMDLNEIENVQFDALGGADHVTIGDLTGRQCAASA